MSPTPGMRVPRCLQLVVVMPICLRVWSIVLPRLVGSLFRLYPLFLPVVSVFHNIIRHEESFHFSAPVVIVVGARQVFIRG